VKHDDDKPPRRVWLLVNGQRCEGILLRSDYLGVVIKEAGGQLMWCSGRDTQGELWGYVDEAET
jgi:hypothetical protein